jgi:hypothetical protein
MVVMCRCKEKKATHTIKEIPEPVRERWDGKRTQEDH